MSEPRVRASAFEFDGSEPVARVHVELSTNARRALLAFGVIEKLNRLELDGGPLEPGGEVVFFPGSLEPAIRILYDAEAELWNGTRETAGLELDGVRFDRRDYERSLLRLVDLLAEARRSGLGVRLAL